MEIDPINEKIRRHIQILYEKRDQIKKRVESLFQLSDMDIPIGPVYKFCSDFNAVRSIGYLAAMNYQDAQNLLYYLTNNDQEIIQFTQWLIHSLTKNIFIFEAFSHVLEVSFTTVHYKMPENNPSTSYEYDIFLSYASEDQKFAEKLATRLRDEGVRVWFDQWRLKAGDHLENKINNGIEQSRRMISIWSENYFQNEKIWKMVEVFSKQHDDMLAEDRPVIPVKLSECNIKPTLKSLIYIDFTKPDDFDLNFRALLNNLDLKSEYDDHLTYDLEDNVISLSQRGKKAYDRGKTFENEVETIYQLLGFTVKRNIQISGKQIDLIIEKKLGGAWLEFVVECKSATIGANERDQILALQNIVQKQKPLYRWIAVSAKAFTPDARRSLEDCGVSCVTYKELINDLVPLTSYVEKLKQAYEDWIAEYWEAKDYFIRPDIKLDITYTTQKALTHFAKWLGDNKRNLLVILGDLGAGKTTLARFLSYQLALNYLSDPVRHPAPVIIPLKDVRKEVSLSGIIYNHFEDYHIDVNYNKFFHLLKTGKIILFLDAFDVMADHVQWTITRSNFHAFKRAAIAKAKVVLTCRTHYFRERQEQFTIIGKGPGLSEVETDLYRDLRQQSNAEVVYLQEFD